MNAGGRVCTDAGTLFRSEWRRAWAAGWAWPEDGEVSLLFGRPNLVLAWHPAKTARQLERALLEHPGAPGFGTIGRIRLSDCYVLLRDYARAFRAFPPPNLAVQIRYQAEQRLSLILAAGAQVRAADLFALACRDGITPWGRRPERMRAIASHLEDLLYVAERGRRVPLLQSWRQGCPSSPYRVLVGVERLVFTDIRHYHFSAHPPVLAFLSEALREAENRTRAEWGVRPVGEEWLGEMELYHAIRKRSRGEGDSRTVGARDRDGHSGVSV
jgi:hypothetical protein